MFMDNRDVCGHVAWICSDRKVWVINFKKSFTIRTVRGIITLNLNYEVNKMCSTKSKFKAKLNNLENMSRRILDKHEDIRKEVVQSKDK